MSGARYITDKPWCGRDPSRLTAFDSRFERSNAFRARSGITVAVAATLDVAHLRRRYTLSTACDEKFHVIVRGFVLGVWLECKTKCGGCDLRFTTMRSHVYTGQRIVVVVPHERKAGSSCGHPHCVSGRWFRHISQPHFFAAFSQHSGHILHPRARNAPATVYSNSSVGYGTPLILSTTAGHNKR